jgi:DNA end-binding protein Ku
MAMRSTWKGTLSFGMVVIPIKLYGATEEHKISLNQLHTECKSQIKMPKWCPKCEKFLTPGEISKGYPLDKERFVELTGDDMAMLPLASIKSIAVKTFAKGVLDPRMVTDHYYLSPDEMGAKAFVLFMKAMETSGVYAVARITMREREHLCAIRPMDGILLMQTLHWTDEVRDYGELMATAIVSEKEMQMAQALISAMTGEAKLEDEQDQFTEAMKELIAAKLSGKVLEAPAAPVRAEPDLVDALMASLKATGVPVPVPA